MAYATQEDITELYGPNALFAADRDGDGEADAPAVARALEDASAEIDSFLASRYDLPLDETPRILRQAAVDMAIYRLAGTSDVISDEIRNRYKDAVATLKRIAAGEQSLPRKRQDLDGDGRSDGPQPVVIEGRPRMFSRDKLRDY